MEQPYELAATSVTSSLVIQLGEIFPGVKRYREAVPAQSLVYPHFFVHQLTVDSQKERTNYWIVNYFVNIRYHVAPDPTIVTGGLLQQQLDDVSIRLMADLEYIYFDDIPVRVMNPRTEKVDGVLHFFCNISVMATKPVEIGPMQEKLDINILLEEDN